MHAISVLNAALVRHLFTKTFINNYHMETTKQSNKNLSIKKHEHFLSPENLALEIHRWIQGKKEGGGGPKPFTFGVLCRPPFLD